MNEDFNNIRSSREQRFNGGGYSDWQLRNLLRRSGVKASFKLTEKQRERLELMELKRRISK